MAQLAETPVRNKLPKEFTMNQIGWTILQRYENFILVEGQQVNPTGKPVKVWYTANVTFDRDGNEIAPITLGIENSLLNRNYNEIRARFERGCGDLKAAKERKENAILEQQLIEQAEGKRLQFLSESEELKAHLRVEFEALYDKAQTWQAIGSNKRAMEILHTIAAMDSFRFYHRNTIIKL